MMKTMRIHKQTISAARWFGGGFWTVASTVDTQFLKQWFSGSGLPLPNLQEKSRELYGAGCFPRKLQDPLLSFFDIRNTFLRKSFCGMKAGSLPD